MVVAAKLFDPDCVWVVVLLLPLVIVVRAVLYLPLCVELVLFLSPTIVMTLEERLAPEASWLETLPFPICETLTRLSDDCAKAGAAKAKPATATVARSR